MSLSEAFADDRAVSVGRLSYPLPWPTLTTQNACRPTPKHCLPNRSPSRISVTSTAARR